MWWLDPYFRFISSRRDMPWKQISYCSDEVEGTEYEHGTEQSANDTADSNHKTLKYESSSDGGQNIWDAKMGHCSIAFCACHYLLKLILVIKISLQRRKVSNEDQGC